METQPIIGKSSYLSHPVHGKSLLHSQIVTLYSQYDYLWVPLVPEPIGPIDQSSLSVFLMANAWHLFFSVKNPK